MRTLPLVLPLAVLLACSADTFTGGDSGPTNDASPAEAGADATPPPGDASADASQGPIDPNSLGNDLVLWLRAEDANFDQGTGLVSNWPDKSPHQQSVDIRTATTSTGCSPKGVSMHPKDINTLPAVSFCSATLEVQDDASLQFGIADPFMVAAVIEPSAGQVAGSYTLASKTTNPSGLSGFGILAPNASNQFDVYLNVNDSHVTSAISSAGAYHVVTMVRRKGTNGTTLTLRVDSSQSSSLVPSQDVSETSAPLVIGGFDDGSGVLTNIIPGKLAEILVVANATTLADGVPTGIDLYLKQKYGI